MDAIANTILKYDGYIWGPWTWYRLCGGEEPTTINCRFVSRSIFTEIMSLPHQFLIDLKQNFKVISVKGREIKMAEGTIIVDIHGPADELRFMEETDFTCNLVDITRTGFQLRHVPRAITYEVNPFETVLDHIKNRQLVPVDIKSAMKSWPKMHDWTFSKPGFYIGPIDTTDVCGICHAEIESGVTTACGHDYHLECLCKWVEKSLTCPMCREVLNA